jgi:hypothetical protein
VSPADPPDTDWGTPSATLERAKALQREVNAALLRRAGRYALGRLKPGEMNKTELAYRDEWILPRVADGRLLWWRFEGLKLRLADLTFYTPDFALMAPSGLIECHEVKGWWGEDDRVKIKVAADLYPFRFVGAQRQAKKHGGGWVHEPFE